MRSSALAFGLVLACASDDSGSGEADGSSSSASTVSSTSASSTNATTSSNPTQGSDDTSATSVDDSSGDGSDDTGPPPGGPGCGFESAAFCDTFDQPSAMRGRAGDLDVTLWSAARGNPQLPTGNGQAIAAGPATVTDCRGDLPAQVYPDQDSIVCDPSSGIASNHLLVAVGAQNYGQNSYRIRRPFDFAGRTGTISFDAQGWLLNSLFGWISVEITEDPTPIPNYSIGADGQTNDEGGAVPRNAIEVQFMTGCLGQQGTVGVRFIDVLVDYVDTLYAMVDQPPCVEGAEGKLNHFEIRLSETHIEVWGSPYSDDGETFGELVQLATADIDLPFSRGWVHLTTHNHATIKYSQDDGFGATHVIDAWVTRWDDVGFDGPVIDFREHEVGDSLVMGEDAWNISGPVMNVGYLVPDTMTAAPLSLVIPAVDLAGMSSAQLAIGMWYLVNQPDVPMDQYVLRYRFNGNAWHERAFTAGELAVLTNGHAQGALGQVMDVPFDELVAGDNVLELETQGVPQNYPPAASAIDLVLAP